MAFLSNTRHTSRPAPVRRLTLLDLLALYRERRALANLDEDALEDLGLTRKQADTESQRHFWDIPANRH